jgi:DNA polymerase-3 subunit delta'
MSLDGVAGNRELVAGLWRELAHRPSHAYLLAGPRGVGKSLMAKGFAHGLLCERAPGPGFCCTIENCPVRAVPPAGRARANAPRCACCDGCVQIAAGVHPDFNYVARAANRSDVLIEQVRGLIDQLGVRPARAPRRVAIIDDAETLNLPAQNALLKTLEEPPGVTLIFLVSDNERALLDTIRSRTRPVRFAPLAAAEIAAILTVRGGHAHDRASALAHLARGSVGRAFALAESDTPPATELLTALSRARALDFDAAQALAQDFFGARDQAADNFELIARLLEEVLCYKLLGTELDESDSATAKLMAELANQLDASAIASLAERALAAREAITGMATSRLQGEQWWMAAGAALRGE